MIRWLSIDGYFQDIATMLSQTCVPSQAADSSIKVECCCAPWDLSKRNGQRWLILHGHYVSGWGTELIACLFSYKANQSIYFGRMWQCSPLIAKCLRLKIVEALLTLTLHTSIQWSYSQWMYARNCTVIIDNQYWVVLYYPLHPVALWPLNVWSTTFHVIWVRMTWPYPMKAVWPATYGM